ncbi:hypothetical protein [Herbiconiux daphne]|uniref:Asp23/Gls24 family envelope stress response protein n=1 Tax=Herbiconiux daphne TaxID=2970914 RepID=A0ABT2H3S6_9MICO|nr:hypothetical protein [Herbiconiux daphne]MCS5734590.1 hypothetical protein [Herbiconiux daphne]
MTTDRPTPVQPADAAAPAAFRGRNRVTARALSAVVSAVAGEALQVNPARVSVDLTDSAGAVSVVIRSPIAIPALGRIEDDPTVIDHFGGTVVARADDARRIVRERVEELTGSHVGDVALRVTSAQIRQTRRVA